MKERQSTKKHYAQKPVLYSISVLFVVQTERTYCFTTVCNKTRCLLEGFLEVVLESLVLVLLGAQLHEFAWNDDAVC